MAKKTLLDDIIESIKGIDGQLIKQSGTTEQMISDLNYKVVAPAKSAADSAVSAADAAVASAQVTSDAVSAIASATEEAKQGANEAMSRAKSAWDVATGAKEAVTDFDPLLKSAQSDAKQANETAMSAYEQSRSAYDAVKADSSAVVAMQSSMADFREDVASTQSIADSAKADAGKALTQIADTASALSDAKTAFNSGVAEAKQLANTAQTTADSAVQSAGENAKALASQANAMSDAKKAIDSGVASAKGLANAAQATADSAIKSAASVASDLTAVASQAKSNADGITKVTSDVGLLQTTVADNSGNISSIQETAKQIQQAVSDNTGNITTAKQTADSAVTVASDARSNATVAVQTASQASITASSASGQAASAVLTANGAMATASNAKSDATVAVQTASGASLTATNAQGDATTAKQNASEAIVQASNAESDFTQLSIRANKIEANVANNSGAIASVQQTANGLTTTVAELNVRDGINLFSQSTATSGFIDGETGNVDPPYPSNEIVSDYIPVSASSTYTFQLWGTTPSGGYCWGGIGEYDSNKNFILRDTLSGSNQSTDTIEHISKTITTTSTTAYVRVSFSKYNDYKAKLEKGSIATPWTPAPTDASVAYNSLKVTVDQTSDIINDPKTGMTATYQTASQASLTAQNASGQAVTAVTTAQGAVTTANNAQSDAVVAKQTASEASVTASNAAGDASVAKQTASQASISVQNAQSDITSLDARADSLEAFQKDASGNINKIVSRADGVDQTLTSQKGDITNLQSRADKLESSMSTANGQISTLQQTATGLTTTVADIKANGGGVNLVKDSEAEVSGKAPYFGGYNLASLTELAPGETYTMSFSAKVDDKAVNCNQFVSVDIYNSSWGFWTRADVPISTDYQRVTKTFTIPEGQTGANHITVYLADPVINGKSDSSADQSDAAGTGYIKEFMLEEGTVAHAWSPSPDDLQNQFAQIKQSIDGVKTTINDPKTGLNATYQTAAGNSSTISSVKGDVTQLQTTANGLTSRVGNLESKTNSQQTAIDQNKSAIALKADQTDVNTLKGTVSQNTAALSTQANQIQSKVSASDVTGMLTGYATQSYAQSLVTQTADKWNLNLTSLQTDVNAIKTTGGGVNLSNGTSSEDQSSGDASQTTGWVALTIATFDNPQAGQQYTISVNAKPNGGSWRIRIWDGTSSTQLANLLCSESTNAAQEQKHVLTFTWPSGSNKYLIAQLSNDKNGGQITWNSSMLEEGTVAHTWSPAPSDMATVTSVTNLSATVDGIKSTVATKADQSTVTQLSNAIQSKVSSSDYTSTISQLNNAINQRVQVGDVISQINQEAGGDTLIQVSNGKKSLILDAGNTVFTGKAWIPDAAISSISADKIMLGSSALYNSDGTLNLVNQSNDLKALIQVKQGLVQNTTQSIISFASDYNNRAFSITPVGATVTPTLFFERYDQTAGHWLGFSRNEVQREGLTFNTWDNDGERFFVSCHARFNKNITAEGTIMQGTWNGTTGKPEAGILSIESGNTIWSGSDYLAIGDHLSNSYTNVIAKSFSQQSTLSSKTNIETVDSKDALDLVNRTDIRSYQYKTDVAQGKTKRYTSLIIDDVNDVSQYYAPDEFTNEERTGRDDGSAVGYLFLAIQELTRRIKTLEEKLNG